MIVRALDTQGDWTFGKGLEDYKFSRDAIAQDIQTRVLSFYGDCFFSLLSGIDWFNLLGAKNQLAIELAVNAMIVNTAGVVSVIQVSASLNIQRELMVTYIANTVYGIVTSNVLVTPANYLTTQDGSVLTDQDGNPIVV